MTISVEDCLAAIQSHTRGLAAAAEGNLDLRIEHCPDWSMADLVWHLASVHWFWNRVASELPTEDPDDLVRPERPADADLIPALLDGVSVLTDTLRSADQQAPCWTWGLEENVWFITRHQVQEAAVHHWDAANAAGSPTWAMDDAVARDAVEEFLTHSVANTRWPMTDAEPLGGPLTLVVDGAIVRVQDGAARGTLAHTSAPGETVGAPPADLLLWLYRRIPGDRIQAEPRTLMDRFRAFSNTD